MKKLDNGKVELEIGDSLVYGNSGKLGEDINIVKVIKDGRIYNHTEHFCKHRKFGQPDGVHHEWSLNGIVYAEEDIILPQDQPVIKFENEQHKRLHNALIKAGFTYDNKREYNRCNWKHGYYNNYLGQLICWDYFKNKLILVRDSCWNNEYELDQKPIQIIIDHYESLTKEKAVQEFQEITPDNIKEVLQGSVFKKENSHSWSIDSGCGGFKFNTSLIKGHKSESIHTHDFDEFLAFVQKRITLKPLPKELSWSEWFDKLSLQYSLIEFNKEVYYLRCEVTGEDIGMIQRSLSRPQQQELILKIIEVYGSVK